MSAIDITREVLSWHARQDPRLEDQVAAAMVGDLEVTSCGFFASLTIPGSVEPLQDLLGDVALEGCAVFADNLDAYADCILHVRAGKLTSLEVYSVAGGNPVEAADFHVRPAASNRADLR